MTLTKRLGLGALLVVAVAIFTTTPALAQSTTITLTNTADPADQDSLASGQATLTDVAYSFSLEHHSYSGWIPSGTVWDFYTGYLTVTCAGLTPGATYRIGPTGIQTVWDRKLHRTNWFPTYSSVRASGTGTVELALPVSFLGCVRGWSGEGWDYREYEPQYQDYALSVDRKEGSKYSPVLRGSFLSPAAPPPL